MTETQFIEQNKEKWEELEKLLNQDTKDADRIQQLFVKVSSDLSYARTFYSNRSVRVYLNNLVQQVFDTMGQKKQKIGFDNILNFLKNILPSENFRQRKFLLLAFIIFWSAFFIGFISSANNEKFAAIMLGDYYVEMTESNINDGDPMAVYKDKDKTGMFVGITINNIRVAFVAFVLGLLGGMGTVYILVYNGIMIGAFQYFFYSKGLFLTSFLTIWIHGTIEISAIIIAGAAGLILGSGVLFPGTYNRATSLTIAAKKSLRIVLGTVPLFIIAGLLESFVTRHTGLPTFVKAAIIILSALFILGVFVLYPLYYAKKIAKSKEDFEIVPNDEDVLNFDKYKFRTFGENMSLAFTLFRKYIGSNISQVMAPLLIYFIAIFWFGIARIESDLTLGSISHTLLDYDNGGLFIFFAVTIGIAFALSHYFSFLNNKGEFKKNLLPFFKKYFIPIFLCCIPYIAMSYFLSYHFALVALALLPPQIPIGLLSKMLDNRGLNRADFIDTARLSYQKYFYFLLPVVICILVATVVILFTGSAMSGILQEVFIWHKLFEHDLENIVFITALIRILAILFCLPLIVFILYSYYASVYCQENANDLRYRFENFGKGSRIFEDA